MVRCAGCANSSVARAANPADDCCAVGWSAHVTTSFFRACCTSHQLRPTMATPGISPVSGVPPSTMKAWVTPGCAFTTSRLADATFAPYTGAFTNAAWCRLGRVTSMPKMGLPVVMSRIPTVFVRVPMMVNCFGSLSGTLSSAGAGSVAARAASAP